MKRNKGSKVINVIGVIVMLVLLYFGVTEAKNAANKQDWEPTEVYEFTNKNIDWS